MRACDLALTHENKSFPLASLIPKRTSGQCTPTGRDNQNSPLRIRREKERERE